MKQIKFRTWDKRENNWVDYPIYIDANGDIYWENHERGLQEADDLIVMQYTGLKDKNGVEIFEGDIVKNIRNGISRKVYWDTYCASFHLSKRGKEESNVDYWSLSNPKWNYEVVGNIYQNKDLLEG